MEQECSPQTLEENTADLEGEDSKPLLPSSSRLSCSQAPTQRSGFPSPGRTLSCATDTLHLQSTEVFLAVINNRR